MKRNASNKLCRYVADEPLPLLSPPANKLHFESHVRPIYPSVSFLVTFWNIAQTGLSMNDKVNKKGEGIASRRSPLPHKARNFYSTSKNVNATVTPRRSAQKCKPREQPQSLLSFLCFFFFFFLLLLGLLSQDNRIK